MLPAVRSSLALRHITLLHGLSDTRLGWLAQECRWLTVESRQPLLLRSGPGAEVFFIVSGRVRIAMYSAGGRQVTFRDHGPGEIFGDLAVIDEGPRSADVTMLEAGMLAALPRPAFMALLREEPVVAERLLRRLAALVRQLSERVIELSTLPVAERLQAELLRQVQEAGVVQGNRACLRPAPRHAELASQISTNREQVSRELTALARAGLLEKEDGALWVADVARLAAQVAAARAARA